MNVQDIDLNVSKEQSSSKVVRIGQGDKGGTTIRATIMDGAVAATLTGLTANFCMRVPGGSEYVRDDGCTVSGSQVTYVVDESRCAAVAGYTDECYFELMDGTEVVYSTERFRIRVLRAVDDDATPGGTWDSTFDTWLAGKDDEVDAITDAATAEMGRATGAMEGAVAVAVAAADAAAVDAREAAAAALANEHVYYTTEVVGGTRRLTMAYALVDEEE